MYQCVQSYFLRDVYRGGSEVFRAKALPVPGDIYHKSRVEWSGPSVEIRGDSPAAKDFCITERASLSFRGKI